MSQGKNLTPEQKQAIVQVKKFMDAERSRGESVSTKKPAIRTANALGFSISTVKNVLSGVQKRQGQIFDPPKIKGHRKAKIDSYQNYIRSENDSECSLSIRTGNRTKIIILVRRKRNYCNLFFITPRFTYSLIFLWQCYSSQCPKRKRICCCGTKTLFGCNTIK